MNQPDIKLLAIDLDGTLFGADLHISERNKQAIAAATAAGVRVTLATGRTSPDVLDRLGELQLLPPALPVSRVTPFISFQGAVVADPLAEKPLLVEELDLALTIEIINYLYAQGRTVNLHTLDATYQAQPTAEDVGYAERSRLLNVRVVPDLSTAITELKLKPIKFVVVSSEGETVNLIAELNARFAGQALTATRSHATYAEVTKRGVNKGTALAYLADRLGLHREQVMAIGDNWNDLEMLRWAGLGLAMGHADALVREQAAYVTASVADDGVAIAIERFILRS